MKMSQNLRRCIKELRKAMSYTDKDKRKHILEHLSNKDCVYKALREISMNIINKQIPLNKKQLDRLNPHAKTIRSLKCGVRSRKARKSLVNQSGGFLPWLIPIVTSVLANL